MKTRTTMALLVVLSAMPGMLWAQQEILKNRSMELGEGPGAPDPGIADKWTEFGGNNIERSPTVNLVPPGDGHALKAFGDGDHTYVGVYQEVLGVSHGQSAMIHVYLYSPQDDKLVGSGVAGLVFEFLDAGGNTLFSQSTYPFNASSPADTWVLAELGPFTAPTNTARARATCRLNWTVGNIWGAVYWDDAYLSINNGPNQLLNGDFETAGVGAGQSSIGIDYWMGFNDQEKSDDFAHDGAYSLKLGVREAYSGLYQNTKVLTEGDQLHMTAYVWNPATDPLVGTSRAGIKLEFSSGGTPPPPEEWLSFDQDDPEDTWVLVSYATTVPQDATLAKIVMVADDTSTTNGPIYFDSAYAERGSAPGVNKLSNPSFELGAGGANGLTDWTEFGGASCTAWKNRFEVPAQQGSYVLKISGSCVAGVYQEIPVVTGEALAISAYLRSKATDPFNDEQGPRAGVKVEWVLGSVPPPVDIGGPGSPNTIHAGAATNTWLPLTIDYPMPAGSNATARFVNLIEKGNALTGHVYFDSCSAIVLNWPPLCYGDLNCDGSIDFADINPFVLYLSNLSAWETAFPGCSLENGDINCDGTYGQGSFGDINPFVALMVQCGQGCACPGPLSCP